MSKHGGVGTNASNTLMTLEAMRGKNEQEFTLS